ncbi:MAG TPA: PAS domain S-box protein [Elusimicrobiales bacterium]|nr:PAS domain S-box protein [Elusimicrobiales bacterium]
MSEIKFKILAIGCSSDELAALQPAAGAALPGSEILAAAQAAEGINLALAEDPDLILLGAQPPGPDGFDLCRSLKDDARLWAIPVVFLVPANDSRAYRLKALQAGADGFLFSPPEAAELEVQALAAAKLKAANQQRQLETERLSRLEAEQARALRKELTEREKVEEVLVREETDYRALAENTPDLVARFDRELRPLYVNPAAARAGILPAAGQAPGNEWESRIKKVFETGRPGQYEDEFHTPDGHRIFSTRLVPEFSPEGGLAAVLLLASDITMRRRAEEGLRFRAALLDNVTDAVHAMDPDGKLIYVNEAMVRATGYARDELLGQSIRLLDLPGDAACVPDRLAKILKSGSAQFVAEHVRKDGSVYAVEVYARAIEQGAKKIVVAIDRDITGRKQMEEALRNSQERFRALVETISDWIWEVDAQGLYTYASPQIGQIQGYAPEEIIGKVPTDFMLPEEAKRVLGLFRPVMAAQKAFAGIESRNLRKDGREVLLETSGVPFFDASGKFCGYRGVARDITVRKNLEAQLLQSRKLESVGRLAGGVAHDFNNILTAIKFYGELIRNELAPQDPRRVDAEEILVAADRAAALTRQLLAFSRRQIMVPKVIDLNSVTGAMLNMLRRLIGEHIELVTRLAAEPCRVKVDPGQLEQVIMNLAVNARDAMPGGGRLTLETAVLREAAQFLAAHPDLPRGPLVRLKVTDTGSGMTPEVRSRIFEPFFTTKEQGKGTGLGLSTVFGIIKQSGGEIETEPGPGGGTAFLIYLPFENSAPPDKDEHKEQDNGAAAKRSVDCALFGRQSEPVFV